MKPIDFRDATFASLQTQLPGQLNAVYRAWVALGPGTTRQVALRSEIDILTLRPRTTDLIDIGLVELCGSEKNEGVYRARSQAEWETWSNEQRAGRDETQTQLI